MRRARRIDLTLGDMVHIDCAFQDSASRPDGTRTALHEYRLTVTADPESLRVIAITAQPRVLPFPECPAATRNLTRLLGAPLIDLRERVLEELKGTAGCTHLNDAVRALAASPSLLQHLLAQQSTAPGINDRPNRSRGLDHIGQRFTDGVQTDTRAEPRADINPTISDRS